MKAYLEEYADALDVIESGQSTAAEIFYPKNVATDAVASFVEPLLGGIMYNQGSPYNNLCPLNSGSTTSRCATGCVATAMAQVMKYYEFPKDYCTGSTKYVSTDLNDTISYDFSTTKFDWDNMFLTYSKVASEYTSTDTLTSTEYFCFQKFSLSTTNSKYLVIDSLANIKGSYISGYLQIILTDNDGNLIQPVGSSSSVALAAGDFSASRTLTFSMPSSLADGTYRFYVGIKKNSTTSWSLIQKATTWIGRFTSREPYYLTVTKIKNNFYVEGQVYACDYTTTGATAVATLMAACGASVSMQYGSESSASTSAPPKAMYNYFGYDKDMCLISDKRCTADTWHNTIQSELIAGRPLILCGFTSSGGGHEFVFDGFKYMYGEPYYHVNWGWGGSSNGYFLTTLLKPSEAGTGGSTSDYSNSNAIITNIQPDDGIDNSGDLCCSSILLADTTYVLPGNKVTVQVSSVQNICITPFSGQVCLYLVNSAGEETEIGTVYSNLSLSYNYYMTSPASITCTIPSTTPFGDYTFAVHKKTTSGSAYKGYCSDVSTLHVVAENPADSMPGVLRYKFDDATLTAQVKAFSYSKTVTLQKYVGNIEVPDSITYKDKTYAVVGIVDSAFYGCTGLDTITISNNIKNIGKYSFYNCSGLKSITLSKGLTYIDNYAFDECSGLTSVIIPDSVAKLGNYVFYDCTGLTSITLPDNLTSLGVYCFENCTSLQSVELPVSLEKIQMHTFNNCSSLTQISIPSNVASIASRGFTGCSSLTAIHMASEVPLVIVKGVFDNTNNCPIYVPAGSVDTYKAASVWVNYADRIVSDINGIHQINADKFNSNKNAYDLQGHRISSENMGKNQIYIIGNKKILNK